MEMVFTRGPFWFAIGDSPSHLLIGAGPRFATPSGNRKLTIRSERSQSYLKPLIYWRPQRDSNPRYRRERAVSWASRR